MIAELPRLNELARKARTAALSADELDEREQLRRRYLQQISGQMKNIVNMLYFSYGIGSPCRTICTACGSPPCMKNKSY